MGAAFILPDFIYNAKVQKQTHREHRERWS